MALIVMVIRYAFVGDEVPLYKGLNTTPGQELLEHQAYKNRNLIRDKFRHAQTQRETATEEQRGE